jgi:hypothetical protein
MFSDAIIILKIIFSPFFSKNMRLFGKHADRVEQVGTFFFLSYVPTTLSLPRAFDDKKESY